MKVKVIKTDEIVEVYKHSERSVYVNSDNCTTEYKATEVKLVKK